MLRSIMLQCFGIILSKQNKQCSVSHKPSNSGELWSGKLYQVLNPCKISLQNAVNTTVGVKVAVSASFNFQGFR